MKTELIKKLRLKKGCKYFIFFPREAGISREQLGRLNREYVELSFLLKTTKGLKVIEKTCA